MLPSTLILQQQLKLKHHHHHHHHNLLHSYYYRIHSHHYHQQTQLKSRIKSTPISVIAFGSFVYMTTVYISYHIYKLESLPDPETTAPSADPDSNPNNSTSAYFHPSRQTNTNHVYNNIATSYDDQIEWDEWLLGIHRLRNALVKKAKVGCFMIN